MGPIAGVDDMEKWKFLILPGLEVRPLCRPVRKTAAIPTTLSRFPLGIEEFTQIYRHFAIWVKI
jgi:hypothetical protein